MLMTATYGSWIEFRDLVARCISAIQMGRELSGVAVWYLNEIRPPDDCGVENWAKYSVLPLGVADVDFGKVTGATGSMVLCPGDDRHVLVDWAQTSKPGIGEGMPLADYYEPPNSEVLAIELTANRFNLEELDEVQPMEELDELHRLVKDTFVKSLTSDGVALMGGEKG